MPTARARWHLDGEIDGVLAIRVEDARITGLYYVRNPEKLARVESETPLTPCDGRSPGLAGQCVSTSGMPNVATSVGSWNLITREMPVAVGASTTAPSARSAPSAFRW
jgi:hypothetical protein